MAEESNKITLVDEEGEEHQFVLLNVVEMDGAKYAVMVPEEEYSDDEEQEAFVFRIETDEDGEEILVNIEDDEEFAKVCELLDEIMAEEDFDEDPQ